MTPEQFNPFNQAIQNCLDTEYPNSLLEAILTVSTRFGIDSDKAASLLSATFKRQLEDEYHVINEHDDII